MARRYKRLASVIDIDNVLCVAQRRCDDVGVSIKFSPYASTPCTDGQTITLPPVSQNLTHTELDNIYGYIIHECGHHVRPEAFAILKAATPPEHLCALFNICEDDGMERERALAWRGDCKALSNMNYNMTTEVADQWSKAVQAGTVTSAQHIEPLAALMLGQLSRLQWDDLSEVQIGRLLNTYSDTAKKLVSDLCNEGWVERLRATLTPHDTWDVAVDLAKRLYPDNDQDQYEEMRTAGHSMNPVKRDASNDMAGDAQGKKAPPLTEAEAKEAEGCVISWKDAVLSDHVEWKEKVGTPGNIGIDWTGFKKNKNKVYLMPSKEVNVVDMKGYVDTSGRTFTRVVETPDNISTVFANRVRRYIQATSRSKVDKEKYHGKLDRGALVRLALPPIDGGEYNKRLFYDHRKNTFKDTAIFVLVDWSGSMQGEKMQHAADAAQQLAHTFSRVLNIPIAIAAFSNGKSQCDIGYIKRFSERTVQAADMAHRFNMFDRFSSANADADALNWAWRELLSRKEKRKMLLVLSDGCPTHGYMRTSPDASLKYMTKCIERDGRVELYGVGICSEAVKEYYTNCRVLHESHEINDTLFTIIKEGNYVKRTTRN